jgi:hypothetical protein
MKWFNFFVYNPFFYNTVDLSHIKYISKPIRNDILNIWDNIYIYQKKQIYHPNIYTKYNDTFLWTDIINKTYYEYYIILGDIQNETFIVKKIIQKPYSLNCNYLKMKHDLNNYMNFQVIFTQIL